MSLVRQAEFSQYGGQVKVRANRVSILHRIRNLGQAADKQMRSGKHLCTKQEPRNLITQEGSIGGEEDP